MCDASNFWDTLAPHHWLVENNYLEVSSVRLIFGDIRQPVLIVGAGQGLVVEELRCQGLRCDDIDLSARMVAYARLRRDLTLFRVNATAVPFVDGTHETVILATGFIHFMADSHQINTVMRESDRFGNGQRLRRESAAPTACRIASPRVPNKCNVSEQLWASP